MDADGMTTLLDVLQLSPGDAQFLLQVGISTLHFTRVTAKVTSEIQQRCIQSHPRILRES